MTYQEFDASFAEGAQAEGRDLASVPVPILLLRVKVGDLGTHYQLWPAIARRATLEEAGGVLYRFLRSNADYLHRSHCADALLKLMPLDDLEAADLTVEHRQPERGLERVRAELERRLGAAFEDPDRHPLQDLKARLVEAARMQTEISNLTGVVVEGLTAHYERVRLRVHALVDGLSTEQLWQRPFPFGNSVGHLLLHLTGNLRYYIGAQIAGTGYVRDRPQEFADPSHRPKDDVLRAFDDAVALVLRTLAAQSPTDLALPYSAVGAEDIKDRFSMFLRCASHADHHAGQMIYLSKQLAPRTAP